MRNSLIVITLILGLGAGLTLNVGSAAAQADEKHPVVVLDTSMGEITIELDPEKAPKTVENFLKYVDDKFYDNLIFHRVIPGFMIQGGGVDASMNEKQQGKRAPIRNESGNGLSNLRGTIAMARHQRSELRHLPVLYQSRRQPTARRGGGICGFRQGDRRDGCG